LLSPLALSREAWRRTLMQYITYSNLIKIDCFGDRRFHRTVAQYLAPQVISGIRNYISISGDRRNARRQKEADPRFFV
jgi:hypothetical protein